ncbi:MAG: hypothetical protein AB1894_24695 [Chloroflexota bacterium]
MKTIPQNSTCRPQAHPLLAALSISLAIIATLSCQLLSPSIRLDQGTLERLVISDGQGGQAQPGDRLELRLGTNECCYYFEPVDVRARWSVEPAQGASIEPRTGVLIIQPNVADGTTYTVTADVENGRRFVTTTLRVYTPAANPLVGTWHEASQIDCTTGELSPAQDGLRELVFKASGEFLATFTPFEIYHDYWGSYTYDLQQGTLSLEVASGNFIPTGLDLQGCFEIASEGSLWLRDIWLGRRDPAAVPGCGHVFAR